jgi:hypothetical protein
VTEPTGAQLRDEALQRVDTKADPQWKHVVDTFVCSLPLGEEFTTDRVWFNIERAGVTTPEPRALGAIMLALARANIITKTGRYQPTTRAKAHARPIPIWRRI